MWFAGSERRLQNTHYAGSVAGLCSLVHCWVGACIVVSVRDLVWVNVGSGLFCLVACSVNKL